MGFGIVHLSQNGKIMADGDEPLGPRFGGTDRLGKIGLLQGQNPLQVFVARTPLNRPHVY